MTSTTVEMDATQLAELEAKPWDRAEFIAYQRAYSGDRQRVDAYGDPLADKNEYMAWHSNMQLAKPLHPCVDHMLNTYRPRNTALLCLEWAHVSLTDEKRIAYTRNEADGLSDRTLVTSIGKYLARHWPHVPDHTRRDVQAFYVPDERVIVSTTPEMIRAVEDGPRSCMASVHGSISFRPTHADQMRAWFLSPLDTVAPDWALHPYACYRPDLGWSMAVRTSAQPDKTRRIDGRALIYNGPAFVGSGGAVGCFVRTYMRNKKDPVTGWSETDFPLHTWLERNGYTKLDAWPEGARLFTPPARAAGTDRRIPYVDGVRRYFKPVEDVTDICAMVHTSSSVGCYIGENTSGISHLVLPSGSRHSVNDHDSVEAYADDNEYDVDECYICEDCGRYHHSDDSHTAQDRTICDYCIENYRWVRGGSNWGRGFTEYYVHEDQAYGVEGCDYSVDSESLPPDVVCDTNGDYRERDDCVWIESCSEFYPEGDDAVVCDTNGDYQLREDCVRTEDTEEWVRAEDAYESENTYGVYFEDEDARDEYDTPDEEEEAEEAPATTVVAGTSDENFALAA